MKPATHKRWNSSPGSVGDHSLEESHCPRSRTPGTWYHRYRRERRRGVQALCLGVAFMVLGCIGLSALIFKNIQNLSFPSGDTQGILQHSPYHSRHLLQTSGVPSTTPATGPAQNCTPAAVDNFPPTYFTSEQRHQGAVVLHILLGAYMFVALALACDDYFVPACECICEMLKLSDDVAGATFMAAGSSAPELATAVIGVFIAKDDIGLGAVVGSAVFNIMFVISICALFAGTVVYLRWYPLVRDCTYYAISIVALAAVICDEVVEWYEALILLLLYVLYIVLMYFNTTMQGYVERLCERCCQRSSTDTKLPLKPLQQKTYTADGASDSEEIDMAVPETEVLLPPCESHNNNFIHNSHCANRSCEVKEPPTRASADKTDMEADDGDDEEEEPASVLQRPEGIFKTFLWVISMPLTLMMWVTIPDCRRRRWKRCFALTFVNSIVWIGLFSYVMVWMIAVVGHTFHIPDTVMGLTFIAAGASVPDAIASLLVIRDGYGDMAVANAVGSNVFDILLCLGLPWFIQSVIVNPGVGVTVYSMGLTYSALTLLATVVFLLVATHLNKWRLTKTYGVILMVVYVLFNVLTSMYELNVFGNVRPPECPSDY